MVYKLTTPLTVFFHLGVNANGTQLGCIGRFSAPAKMVIQNKLRQKSKMP
jgi:hypothetical protein